MAATESEIAAQLIERLLADPAFRDRFRRDPALACREAGLDGLAEEMRLGGGKAMHTLDIRESRSSLAGVMMAAAMEGMGMYEFSKHVVPHIEDLTGSLGDVLSRVNLPALPGAGSLSGAPEQSAAPLAPPDEGAEEAAGGNGAAPVAGASSAAAAPSGAGASSGADAAGSSDGAKSSSSAKADAAPAPPEIAGAVAASKEPPAAPELADPKPKPTESGGELRTGTPGGAELPDGPVRLEPSEGGPEPAAAGAAQAAPAPAAQPAPAVPAPAAAAVPIDPGQFGQEGSGGAPDAEALAVLNNENVVFDEVGVADLKAGRIDPRIVGVLTKLSQEHKIVVSCMCSDHSKFTAGGSISNHAFGRGLDIASIDGEIVSPGSALAREIASELSGFDPAIRPDEIGSPFAINGPGYFTDAAHQNHIHVGFKQSITPDFKLPAELAAGAPAAPAAVQAAPAAAPAPAPAAPAAAPAPDPRKQSGLFAALQPGKLASATPGPAKAGDSNLFLKAVAPEPQPAAAPAAVPAEPVAAPATPALEATGYPGDDAPREQIAAWMGAEAQKRGLPPQLPVMAGLVESGLKNLNFGDADSVGYFQMRLSIWNQGEYAGYPDDPDKQLDWFLDTAQAVKDQRISRGQPIDDPNQYGEWIADVERPAEQFRGRYQPQLDQANQLLNATPTPPPAPEPTAPPAPAAPAAAGVPIDPGQFGQEGSGGAPDAEALAVLNNENVVFDEVGVADLKAGRIDPRIVGVLTKLSQEHKIVVSCMCSDHSKFTAGGSISNHAFGRGLDIASIDGEIVSPGSALAREIASELSGFDPAIRPDEIGSPFAINGPGYFTDAAHQNHIHVGFKQSITPDFKLPGELAAGAPAAPAAVQAAPAAAPAPAPAAPAAAPAPDPRKQSGLFAALQPGKLASATPGPAKAGDSNLFLKAVAPEPQPAAAPAAVPAEPVAAPATPALEATGYPGDDAPREQIAAWMGAEAQKRGLPPQLPVMAGLVESGLKNLNFGDADSVGYFQMRLSIWNQGEYAGYPDDPDKQLDWFLDTAQAVKDQRISRGQPIDDPNQYGEWIADVERPAEQFRGRYQPQLDQANQLLNATPTPPPAPEPTAPPADAAAEVAPPAMAKGAGPKALAALEEAKKHTGTPYRWGGSTPQTGFDCSGLVQWAYAQAGVKIPRVTDDQIAATNGTAVARAELLPGDLVFFRDASGYVHHVGISMGGDKFLHAPHTGDVVKVSSLDEPYYKEQFTGGRRFDAPAAAPAPAAPAAPAVPAAPAIDPVAVASAQAAVARDAAEAQQQDSGLFRALVAQEARKDAAADAGGDRALASAGDQPGPRESALFLRAITAEEAEKARAEAATPPAEPPAPAQPAAPEPATAPAGPPPDLSAVPADYPGDDAGQQALAKWLAKEAEKSGLPPELPVMAALVESGVKNLNFGDADSVGFFQMRLSIWNQGEYAGYPDNPGLQIKWFVDHALAHKKQQIARGDADFGKDPGAWGEWIADVERPAEQFRGRYQERLEEARALLR